MSGNTDCKVYVGNLHERVSDRVLYDILIQAGRVVHSPRRGNRFAFAECESAEVADYAVHLFSGLVSLYNQTQDYIAHHSNP